MTDKAKPVLLTRTQATRYAFLKRFETGRNSSIEKIISLDNWLFFSNGVGLNAIPVSTEDLPELQHQGEEGDEQVAYRMGYVTTKSSATSIEQSTYRPNVRKVMGIVSNKKPRAVVSFDPSMFRKALPNGNQFNGMTIALYDGRTPAEIIGSVAYGKGEHRFQTYSLVMPLHGIPHATIPFDRSVGKSCVDETLDFLKAEALKLLRGDKPESTALYVIDEAVFRLLGEDEYKEFTSDFNKEHSVMWAQFDRGEKTPSKV